MHPRWLVGLPAVPLVTDIAAGGTVLALFDPADRVEDADR